MGIDRKVIYAHHLDDVPQKSVAAIAAKVRQGGATEFAPKIWQGDYLMGAAGKDKSPLAPKTLDDLASLYNAFKAEGVTLVPYGVAFGGNWQAEAAFAIEVAKHCGGVVELDLEPYPDFWTVNRDKVDEFARAVVDAKQKLYIDQDLRPAGTDPFPPGALKGAYAVATRVLGQCYCVTFGGRPVTTFPTKATSYTGGTGWVDVELDYLKSMGVAPQKRGMILEACGWKGFGDAAIALNLRDARTLGLWHLAGADDTCLWAFEACAPSL